MLIVDVFKIKIIPALRKLNCTICFFDNHSLTLFGTVFKLCLKGLNNEQFD